MRVSYGFSYPFLKVATRKMKPNRSFVDCSKNFNKLAKVRSGFFCVPAKSSVEMKAVYVGDVCQDSGCVSLGQRRFSVRVIIDQYSVLLLQVLAFQQWKLLLIVCDCTPAATLLKQHLTQEDLNPGPKRRCLQRNSLLSHSLPVCESIMAYYE